MKKELSENDIKYPILSMLFDGPEELAARAEALQNSIAHDMIDDSHPRIRQLEIISELFKNHNANNGMLYQQALHRVSLANIRQLLEGSEQIDDRTKLITTVEQVQKLASQLSFTVNVSLENTNGQLSLTETASLDAIVSLTDRQTGLGPNSSVNDVIAWLDARGYKTVDANVNHIRFDKISLSINDRLALEYRSVGIESRFLSTFFHGATRLKKGQLQVGDIADLLKDREDNPSITSDQLRRRYCDARIRINRTIKAESGIDEFICYKNKTFYINPNLLS